MCQPPRPVGISAQRLERLLTDPALTPGHRRILARVVDIAEAADCPPATFGTVVTGLHRVLADQPGGGSIRLSRVHAELGRGTARQLVRTALADTGMLDDDTVPAIRVWVDTRSSVLPPGYRDEVHAWLVELLEGGPRSRPRSPSTIYVYFGRVRPHLTAWSATRHHLREVTKQDVTAVLDRLQGHQRAGVFTALRSLFSFAKRRRLVFVNPTSRISVGAAPRRMVLPMTDDEIAAVNRVVVTPAQRLIVALAAVHALRAAAIRALTVDDLDLAARRIHLAGRDHPMSDLVHRALTDWLAERHRVWPHTPNRHVLISADTAIGTGPVSDYYLSWHLSFAGVQLEQIRADRVLHEALAVDADPLHLATAFGLSSHTAISYSAIARSLIERPIETALDTQS